MKPEQWKLLETSPVTCVHPYSYPTSYQGRPSQPPWQAVAAGVTTWSRWSLPYQGALPGNVPPGPQSKSFSGFSVLASCLICELTGLFLQERAVSQLEFANLLWRHPRLHVASTHSKGSAPAKTVSVKDPTMTVHTSDSTHR